MPNDETTEASYKALDDLWTILEKIKQLTWDAESEFTAIKAALPPRPLPPRPA